MPGMSVHLSGTHMNTHLGNKYTLERTHSCLHALLHNYNHTHFIVRVWVRMCVQGDSITYETFLYSSTVFLRQ